MAGDAIPLRAYIPTTAREVRGGRYLLRVCMYDRQALVSIGEGCYVGLRSTGPLRGRRTDRIFVYAVRLILDVRSTTAGSRRQGRRSLVHVHSRDLVQDSGCAVRRAQDTRNSVLVVTCAERVAARSCRDYLRRVLMRDATPRIQTTGRA
jgi:hypothetical protein